MGGVIQGFLRTYMLAYFLPSALFTCANTYIFLPIFIKQKFGIELPFLNEFEHHFIFDTIIAAFMAFAFMSSSSYLVKLFEGYNFRWILFFIYIPLKLRQKLRRNYYISKIRKINQLIDSEETSKDLKKFYLKKKINVQGDFYTKFSEHHKEMLPTSFGNILKAFENYPYKRYGIDSVLLWPRLVTVITPEYGDRLEEANNSVIFLLVSCFLFTIMSFESFLIYYFQYSNPTIFKILMISFAILSISFYRISLRAALNYGEIIKSCFDLFRFELLKAFGVEKKLLFKNERSFWEKLRTFILVGEVDPFSKYQVKT